MTKDASRKVKEPASGRMQTGQEMALTSIVSSGVHYELVSSEVSLDYTVHTKCPGGRKRAPIVCALVVVWVPHTHTHNGYTDKLRESSKARGYHTHTHSVRGQKASKR